MGTVKTTKLKNGFSYRAQIRIGSIREGKTFPTKGAAQVWIDEREHSIRTGEVSEGEIPKGDMLIYAAMEKFIVESRKMVSKSQIKSYENSELIYRRTFKSNKKMSEITHQDIAAHVLKRMTEDEVGPSSIRNELSFMRGVYQKSLEWGIDIPSPELSIKRPKAKMRSREDRLDNIIKHDELAQIFKRAGRSRNNLYYYLKFLLYTGMRPSEAACLYWDRLSRKDEISAEKMKLPVGFVDLERGGFSKVGTKTEKRFVPGHPKALEVIEELRKNRPDGKKMVFLDDKYIGKHMAYKYYRRSFQTVCSNAVEDEKDLREEITFYSFRHTFRSKLEECGCSTAFAETIIGHSDRSFKFTYIHLSDKALIGAVQLLAYDIDI